MYENPQSLLKEFEKERERQLEEALKKRKVSIAQVLGPYLTYRDPDVGRNPLIGQEVAPSFYELKDELSQQAKEKNLDLDFSSPFRKGTQEHAEYLIAALGQKKIALIIGDLQADFDFAQSLR